MAHVVRGSQAHASSMDSSSSSRVYRVRCSSEGSVGSLGARLAAVGIDGEEAALTHGSESQSSRSSHRRDEAIPLDIGMKLVAGDGVTMVAHDDREGAVSEGDSAHADVAGGCAPCAGGACMCSTTHAMQGTALDQALWECVSLLPALRELRLEGEFMSWPSRVESDV